MSDIIPNQIDYTSRDYRALREDLIQRVRRRIPEWLGDDPADFGVVLLEAFAHIGDVMSYYIDRAANESTLSTATRRSSVVALAKQLGYQPFGYRPARTIVTFGNSSDEPVVLPARTKVSAVLDVDNALITIPFETDEAAVIAAGGTATAKVTQGDVFRGETGFGVSLGMSDGLVSQRFLIPDQNIVSEEVEIFTFDGVNYAPWRRVDYLSDFTALSRVFSTTFNSAGVYTVVFGDGVSGFIPPTGHQVYCRYRAADGSRGNVPAGAITEITEIPGLTFSQVATLSGVLSVTNYSPAAGGTDEQSTESIRVQAPKFYRAANRAITVQDFEGISLGVSGCGKASAVSETLGTVVVAIAPYRDIGLAEDRPGYDFVDPGWVLSTEMTRLMNRVRSALNDAKVIGSAVSVIEPVYVPIEIGLEVDVAAALNRENAGILIKEELLTRLDYAKVEFGSTIYESDLVALVSDLGISTSVSVNKLRRVGDESLVGTVTSAFDEILRLDADSITLTLTGGVEGYLESP